MARQTVREKLSVTSIEMRTLKKQQGLTLIELIISIVVIGIALAGVLSVMNLTVSRSADPMIQHQAIAIAEAYLEEILTKDFNDSNCSAGSGSDRSTYCAVDHYSGPSHAPQDQLGNSIGALSSYQVSIIVGSSDNINGVPMKRIDVTVIHPSGVNLTLSGYRANI